MSNFEKIQELLRQKADVESRLKLLPHKGTPEIKTTQTGRYIYIRYRELGKLKSVYVDKYSEELYAIVVNSAQSAKELTKKLRKIEKELALL